MKKRLLIIPARKGSKRIPNKNIKFFCGKPIISYSIQAALKSKIFNKIHVSTNDVRIKKILKKYKMDIDFFRPNKLSGDKIGLIDVFKFVLKKYESSGYKFDEIWYLAPCSPLIETLDLKRAAKYFNKNSKFNFMLAVSEYSPPIQWAFEKKNRGLKPKFSKYSKYRSQDLTKMFYDTGTFGAFKSSYFSGTKQNLIGFNIPRYKGIDIDTKEDWLMAEKILKSKK